LQAIVAIVDCEVAIGNHKVAIDDYKIAIGNRKVVIVD